MLYVATFLLLAALRLWAGPASSVGNRIYWVALVCLFVFSAFRFNVGCDWIGYLNQYAIQSGQLADQANDPSFIDTFEQREPLWWMLIEVIDVAGLPYPWLNVASSAIFFAGIHRLARRQPDRLGFLVLLFPILVINMPMSGIRQAAAIGIMCIAYNAFVDRRAVRFVLVTLVASLLHNGALVFLLFSPLINGEYTARRVLVAAGLALPGIYLLSGSEAAEIAMARYIATGVDAAGSFFRIGLLSLSGLFFLLVLRNRWSSWFPEEYRLAISASLSMIALFPLLVVSTVIGDRIGYFLVPIQALILSRVPFLYPKGVSTLLVLSIYAVLAAALLTWVSLSWHFHECYLPYKTWLFGFPDLPV